MRMRFSVNERMPDEGCSVNRKYLFPARLMASHHRGSNRRGRGLLLGLLSMCGLRI